MSRFEATVPGRTDWATPPDLVTSLSLELLGGRPFGVDLAARSDNTIAPVWLGPGSPIAEDALACDWYHDLGNHTQSAWWLNPPYGRGISRWVDSAMRAAMFGATIVALLPARVDTRWFAALDPRTVDLVALLKGRVTFVGAPAGARFPSCVIVFRRALSPAKELRIVRWST